MTNPTTMLSNLRGLPATTGDDSRQDNAKHTVQLLRRSGVGNIDLFASIKDFKGVHCIYNFSKCDV